MEAAIIACGSSALQPLRSLCLFLSLLSLLLASLTARQDWGTVRRQGSVTTTGVGASTLLRMAVLTIDKRDTASPSSDHGYHGEHPRTQTASEDQPSTLAKYRGQASETCGR
jgi:hypothetical protein